MQVTRQKLKQQHGFTLIELMVVIVIIGLLVAIALPNFVGAQDRAKQASVKANAHTLQTLVETYSIDWGGRYPNTIPAIRGHDAYKRFSNPFSGLEDVADTSGRGAWRTNDDGDLSYDSARLLSYPDDDTVSAGLVIYVGLDAGQLATTRFLGADGSSGASAPPTTSYMIYACDKIGMPIRRFLLSNGQPTPAGARLLSGS